MHDLLLHKFKTILHDMQNYIILLKLLTFTNFTVLIRIQHDTSIRQGQQMVYP